MKLYFYNKIFGSIGKTGIFLSNYDVYLYTCVNRSQKTSSGINLLETISAPGYENYVPEDYKNIAALFVREIRLYFSTHKQKKYIVDSYGLNIGKTIHIGHIRTLLNGHFLKSLMEYFGDKVDLDTHYGDGVAHVSSLVYGCFKNGGVPDTVYEISKVYKKYKQQYLDERPEELTAEIKKHYMIGVSKYSKDIEKIEKISRKYYGDFAAKMGIYHDFTFGEKDYYQYAEYLKNHMLKTGIAHMDKDGRVLIDKTVLTNSSGTPIYSLIDIATLLERDHMGYEKAIYIVDSRQKLHFETIKKCMKHFSTKIELVHMPYGFVTDLTKEVLKSRSGESEDSFIEEFDKDTIVIFELKHRLKNNYMYSKNLIAEEQKNVRAYKKNIKTCFESAGINEPLTQQEKVIIIGLLRMYEALVESHQRVECDIFFNEFYKFYTKMISLTRYTSEFIEIFKMLYGEIEGALPV